MVNNFNFENTTIKGLKKITPFYSEDNRGCFIKDYSVEIFVEHGIKHELKEVFYTVSQKGVVRAIHFQREKQQEKLVRCISGAVYDVVVDLRPDSPTFKVWESFELNDDNNIELYIPGGCGHGYLVLEPSIVSYKCNEKFYVDFDDGIIWDDKDLAINWPINKVDDIILSTKDKNLQSFSTFIQKYNGLV